MPNFMKIRRGPDFFWLIWYGMTHMPAQFNTVEIIKANTRPFQKY